MYIYTVHEQGGEKARGDAVRTSRLWGQATFGSERVVPQRQMAKRGEGGGGGEGNNVRRCYLHVYI